MRPPLPDPEVTARPQRQRGELEVLTPKKRGPKVVVNPLGSAAE
ncbi:MAG: hypothetical protein ACP5EP_13320 [Acidobacteriaceae bacterium]